MASFSGNSWLPIARRLLVGDRALLQRRAPGPDGGRLVRPLAPPGRSYWAASISGLVHATLLVAGQWWLLPPPPQRMPLALEVSTLSHAPAMEAIDFSPEVASESAGSRA